MQGISQSGENRAVERCSAESIDGFWPEKYGGSQGAVIEAIVSKIWNEIVNRLPVDIRCEAVPLDVGVKEVAKLFRLYKQTTVHVVLLWGMGGIGKTTLARAIFHRHQTLFNEASFVENCGDQNALEIQNRLRKDLLRDEGYMRGDIATGREFLKHGLSHKKVLIVLDDLKYDSTCARVEEIIDLKSLCSGSRILITSRDQRLLPYETDFSDVFGGDTYEVQLMGHRESWQFFCFHAFKGPSASPGLEDLAKNVVEACHGLPLSLEVLGRHLRSMRTRKTWEEAIIKLRSNRYGGISGKLKISYEGLDREEQEMFKDVACFVIGQYESRA